MPGTPTIWPWCGDRTGPAGPVEPLPFPGSGDPNYLSRINALLDDGAGAGYYTLYYGLMYPNDIPVRWYPSGALTEFPVPDGYFAGRANATNENGDASGSLYMNDGTDPTYIYGVIWVQEGGSNQSLILTSMVGAMTPRFADGSFLVATSDPRPGSQGFYSSTGTLRRLHDADGDGGADGS